MKRINRHTRAPARASHGRRTSASFTIMPRSRFALIAICRIAFERTRVVRPRSRSFATFATSDAYDVLGVTPSTSMEDVKKAYRAQALRWHPDRASNATEREVNEEKFKKVSAAYAAIVDGSARRESNFRNQRSSSNAETSSSERTRTSANGFSGHHEQSNANASWTTSRTRSDFEREFAFRREFTRDDAERIFREMFGADAETIGREIARAMREGAMGRSNAFGGFGPGARGTTFRSSRTFASTDVEDMLKAVFGAAMRASGPQVGYNEITETSYVNARGETVVRRVIRTRGADGAVSESVTERVVGRGNAGASSFADARARASSQWERTTSENWERRPPPPPGASGAAASVNPLVEIAVGAARAARVAAARFLAAFGARMLTKVLSFIVRRLFGGR